MKKIIIALKTLLIIEIIAGLFVASFMALFLGVMATDSPSSTYLHMIGGGTMGFVIVFIPSVLLPYFSIRELKNYAANNKIIVNIINALLLIFCFFPLGIVCLILLYKLHNSPADST